ncbi:thiamine pyrophosphate-binding protein [Tepidiforma sp.]|uniref:thiamine pyrophosphate-binding protein n=1 Tax=Tepidiforma sp. TaxID=2682230 RepID=UPI00260B931B|nr:thiamine pyrophosphate-binding protein [Tepidiforma sp.]MCX7618259.1 thiamine pyrophosphate-binding protein [Tepidiforma sp.]
MTGGEAVYHALRALGVEHVFGIVSVHNIPIYDAIHRLGGITPVAVRHEQGALHAADGYARATGRLGVAIASTGPGTTNAMTGLYEAQFASSRVLLITGQVESLFYGKGKGFLHEAEAQLPMLRTVTRRAESVRRTEDIAETIVSVARDISTGRPAPGAVEIPIDLQYARAEVDVPHVEGWPRIRPQRDALSRAADVLKSARRILIWAGGGVLAAGAEAELQQLAEALGAPVVTSANGRGAIPEDHPLALGPLSAHPGLQEVFETAEAVLAVGTRFQAGPTRNWTLRFGGRLIHVDADPAVIGRSYQPDVPVVGDARLALAALLRDLDGHRADPDYAARAAELRDAAREQVRREIGPDYEAIMDAIRDLAPRDALIVRDATVPAYLWGNRLLPILAPRTSLYPTSAAIGPALPLAIGAAIGAGRPAVVIQGDGGFMLNIGELATAAQYAAPVIVCVFNDRGYGVLRSIEGRTFEGRQFGVDLATPDFVRVAEGMGIPAEAVDSAAGFRAAFQRALQRGGPALLDIDMSRLVPMGGLGTPPPRPKPAAG